MTEAVTDGEALDRSPDCRPVEADWVDPDSLEVHAVTVNRELATKAAAIMRRRESRRVIELLLGVRRPYVPGAACENTPTPADIPNHPGRGPLRGQPQNQRNKATRNAGNT